MSKKAIVTLCILCISNFNGYGASNKSSASKKRFVTKAEVDPMEKRLSYLKINFPREYDLLVSGYRKWQEEDKELSFGAAQSLKIIPGGYNLQDNKPSDAARFVLNKILIELAQEDAKLKAQKDVAAKATAVGLKRALLTAGAVQPSSASLADGIGLALITHEQSQMCIAHDSKTAAQWRYTRRRSTCIDAAQPPKPDNYPNAKVAVSKKIEGALPAAAHSASQQPTIAASASASINASAVVTTQGL